MAKFRDPVHNFIVFDDPEDRLYVDLINTKEFQRLRHIRQLGLSNFTYPGAEHTRLAHSLGVAHLMKRFVDHLLRSEFPETRRLAEELGDQRQLAVAAALLHDIGHGPFSHALEQMTKERHEQWTIRILLGRTEVREVLEGYRSGMADEIAEVIRRTHASHLLVKLLSSQLDVDRMDYLLRDSLMTGARYGQFDLEWLINTLRIGRVYDEQSEVGLDLKKGKSVAEDFVMARYYMYQHVYLHKTTRSADLIVEKIFERAMELTRMAVGFALPPELARLLNPGKHPDLENYLQMTDHHIWHYIYQWSRHPDPILSRFCNRIIQRRFYKGMELVERPEDRMVWMDVMEQIRQQEGIPLKYIFLEDESSSSLYNDSYLMQRQVSDESEGEQEASQNIFLFDNKGEAHELAETSDIIRAIRNQRVAIKRLYVPEHIRALLSEMRA